MPTYTYACAACDHEFEREQRISEDPLKKCPKCGKNKAYRTISQGNFILKGGGWYSDGYGASKSSTSSSTSSSSGISSTSSDSGSSSTSSDSSPSKGKDTAASAA
jgi:putative FmdB family regulatory protein